MNTLKTTPLNAARVYAAKRRDESGRIIIVSMVPRGKYGRLGFKSRQDRAWIARGDAAMERSKSHWYNGQCEVCGYVYLEPVIAWAFAPDPDAGREAPFGATSFGPISREGRYQIQWSPRARMRACPVCVEAVGLELGFYTPPLPDHEKRIDYAIRTHPTLAHFALVPDLAAIDIGYKDQPLEELSAKW